jgi:hypothetical protein
VRIQLPEIKISVFLVLALCGLVNVHDISVVLAASIIALMIEAVSTFETWVIFTRLCGVTTQKILYTCRSENHKCRFLALFQILCESHNKIK